MKGLVVLQISVDALQNVVIMKLFVGSRVARWKRVGPKSRSASIFFYPITMFKGCFTAYLYLFCIKQFKRKPIDAKRRGIIRM